MAFRVAPGATWFETPEGLVLHTRGQALVFEGDAAPVVKSMLTLLLVPRERGALDDAFGADVVDELLDALSAAGVLELDAEASTHVRSPALASLVERGVRIVAGRVSGAELLVSSLEASLQRVGWQSAHTPLASAFDAPGLVVGCFASPFDPDLLRLNEAALSHPGRFLPVVLDDEQLLIGPLLEDGAPCARCTLLRVFARGTPEAHAAWFAMQEAGAVPEARVDERAAGLAGEHVIALLRGLDEHLALDGKPHALVRVRLDGGATDARRVLRHSFCRACGPKPPTHGAVDAAALARQQRSVEEHWREIFTRDPEVLVPPPEVAEMYRDPVTGILVHGEEWQERRHYFRNLPETWGGLALCREQEMVSTGFQGINGTGPNLEHLRLVMLSEGIERYAQYAHRPVVEGVPFHDVREFAFNPAELTLFDEEQYRQPGFPRPRFREDLPLNWTWGYGLKRGEAKLFPQELITVACTDEGYPNRLVNQYLTTGAASHVSYTRALQNAMRELIERDQFMIAWYKRVRLPRVELPRHTGNAYVDDLIEFLRASGVKLDLFDMRLDFPLPAFLLLATVDTPMGNFLPGGTVGAAAADLDPVTALGRTLGEMRIHFETLAFTPNEMKDFRNNPYDPHDVTQGWRAWWPNYMWHLNPQNRRAFDWLYDHDLKQRFDEIESIDQHDVVKNRDRVLQALDDNGLEPWAWDLHVDEIAPSGFRVVKVEIPGICHLVPGRQSRRLACRRFEEVPKRLGRPCLPEGEQNPDPHVQA